MCISKSTALGVVCVRKAPLLHPATSARPVSSLAALLPFYIYYIYICICICDNYNSAGMLMSEACGHVLSNKAQKYKR